MKNIKLEIRKKIDIIKIYVYFFKKICYINIRNQLNI